MKKNFNELYMSWIQNKTNKRALLSVSAFSIIVFFIGIFFIDNRWWWSMLIIVPLCTFTFFIYKEDINKATDATHRFKYACRWLSLFTFIFVITSAIFITPLWWLGLLLVIAVMIPYGSFEFDLKEDELPAYDKKIIIIITSTLFLITFLLFCVPSFVANANRNPKDEFNSSWSAVESYNLYGLGSKNIEHVIARSWYSTDEYYVNDYVNTIWSNQVANSARANLPFGNVKEKSSYAIYDNGLLIGHKNDEYFMPTDEFKGDVARIVLYMYVTYKDDEFDTSHININLMKTWSRQDPVDSREKARNDLIESQYGYRNKFVNTPWLVGFIV